MTVIEHIEVGATPVASIVFDEIPADYTDLYVVASLRNNGSGGGGFIKLNTVGASYRTLYGDGSNPASQTSDLSGVSVPSSFTANTFSNMTFYIPNYTSSNNKSVSFDGVLENNATTSIAGISAALVSTGSAVTTLEFYSNDGNLVQYSSATLYGITAGSSGGVTVS